MSKKKEGILMRKVTKRKLCAMLIAVLMMVQMVVVFPATVSASPFGPHLGVTITEIANANPNQVSVRVEMGTLSPILWMSSLLDIHYDSTRLEFAGHTVVQDQATTDGMLTLVNPNPFDGTPPTGFRAVRLGHFHAMAQFTNAPTSATIFHFNIRPNAPAGTAQIRWVPGSAAGGSSSMLTELFFRNPVSSDFANILIN